MKLIFALSISMISFFGFSQVEVSSNIGCRLNAQSSVNAMFFEYNVDDVVLMEDGSTAHLTKTDRTEGFAIGGRIQAGYQFNQKLEFGVQAGTFVNAYFNYFVPMFQAYTSLGAYGKYNFGDRLSLQATADSFKIPSFKPGIAFGIAPEYKVGKSNNIGLRFSAQYYNANNEDIYPNELEIKSEGVVVNYSKPVEITTSGVMFELGLAFNIID